MWRDFLDEIVWEFHYQTIFEEVHTHHLPQNMVSAYTLVIKLFNHSLKLKHTHTQMALTKGSPMSGIEDSLTYTEDCPAPCSDHESYPEELDEPVGPPPTATDESTTVQSPHRMDQQETSEDKCKSLLCLEQSGRAS